MSDVGNVKIACGGNPVRRTSLANQLKCGPCCQQQAKFPPLLPAFGVPQAQFQPLGSTASDDARKRRGSTRRPIGTARARLKQRPARSVRAHQQADKMIEKGSPGRTLSEDRGGRSFDLHHSEGDKHIQGACLNDPSTNRALPHAGGGALFLLVVSPTCEGDGGLCPAHRGI